MDTTDKWFFLAFKASVVYPMFAVFMDFLISDTAAIDAAFGWKLAIIVAGAFVPLLLVVAFTVTAVDEIKRIRAARTTTEQ